ncbi:DNA-directed RNA polymerase, mitochondrial [Bombina bombina]|uniref:DNA-directed RNA polymerase, mitochondrial n=1 Tax=Bombina bombina TaxID=8345 RepID=UPI00235A5489|nr:DNA-directed RNA polymerase, mitochondrial [Bombina bombina]
MSVLRLGVLSRLLREKVESVTGLCPQCMKALELGCRWNSVYRWSSSAKPKNEASERSSRTDLLEVLETRVEQLQAEEALSVSEGRNATPSQSTKSLSPIHKEEEKGDLKHAPQTPKRWMEKLISEQKTMHLRQGRLDKNNLRTKRKHLQTLECKSNFEIKFKRCHSKLKPSVTPPAEGTGEKEMLKTKSNMYKSVTRETTLQDKEGNRYGGIQLNILCFMETCIFLGHLDKALNCLSYYHQSIARRSLLSTAMYNLLIKGFAKQGSLSYIGQVFSMLEEAGVKPNISSYAATLECMGRRDCNAKAIKRCLNQMKKDGFSTDQLFQDYPYQDDEKDMVLKALNTVNPHFEPPTRPKITCNSPLVAEFYSKDSPSLYPKLDFNVSELHSWFEEQLNVESSDTITINSVESSKPVSEGRNEARDQLDSLHSHWRKALLDAFHDSKNHLEWISRKSRKINLYPFLCLLEEEQYVEIMLQSLTRMPPTGESFLLMSRELGSKIYNRFSIRRKLKGQHLDKIRHLYMEYCQLLAKDGQVSEVLPREMWEQLEEQHFGGSCLLNMDTPWPNSLLVQLGTHLVDMMVQEIKIQNNLLSPRSETKLIPVLYHMYSFRSTRQIGLIKPHPIFSQLLLDAGDTSLTFESSVMPMLCPPVPWTSPRFGAYLLTPAKLMRCTEGAVQHQLLLEKSPPGQLHPVLDSLNQLGLCAWRINQPVLDIIISIFNEKGCEKLDIPPPLSEAPQLPVQPYGDLASWDKMAHQRELSRCRKKSAEMYSLRMDALYKLSVAKHLRDQIFWFPHNMDFRGRTYPCPPYFNHLGSDVTRALLLFAEGQQLGPQGFSWLKTHLINLTGLKKRNSIRERQDYAEEIMEEILDSADRPLTGRRWWMEADEPWQALACCMEIAKASRSPDPTKYISHFPVHQDGSCNGLQHYAALGRDEIGARSVNLMPSEIPQDVYSGVAQQVEAFRKRDAQHGVRIAQVLDGFIGRKVVKQTVMTVVYGVTRYGGRLQIEKRLRELESFPQEYVWEASHYLVQQVFSSLKEMFSGTREIQLWLTESARMISKSGSTVEWLTPLGLPIIQPYHRNKQMMFHSNLQMVNLQNSHDADERPDTMKQKNAFPPNFIHSLDSTHMMLTALHCYKHGLTFVSVHDCFWTHAHTVDIMNKVCREQFVALHKQPILLNLSEFLLKKYCPNVMSDGKNKRSPENLRMMLHFNKVPETGKFDLDKVKDSTYFFS